MRLINCKTRQFEEFFDQDIPRYAILSHTWDGAEVPFKDYHHPERHTLYSVDANNKIEQTCQKAKEDGFDYVWIDSCNIDKSSSAELTEAINSMYKWYEGAERCYIYLSDLSLDVETFEQIRDYKESCKPYLANCKWFARGWGEFRTRLFVGVLILTLQQYVSIFILTDDDRGYAQSKILVLPKI